MNAFIFNTKPMKTWQAAACILGEPALTYTLDAVAGLGVADVQTFPQPFASCVDDFKTAVPEQGQALVFTAPLPLIGTDGLRERIERHVADGNACTVIADFFVFEAVQLKKALEHARGLQDVLEALEKDGGKVEKYDRDEQFIAPETPTHLAHAAQVIKTRINLLHMEKGVCFTDPSQAYIGPHVTIGEGTLIYPGTILEGAVTVGKGCKIGPNTRIADSIIGDYVSAEASVILDSGIGNYTNVGPFAYVRPHSSVGEHCKIGDFVEIKNSTIGNRTKASHLTYVGDSDVGENVNFGCGTVTVNYDGAHKWRATIENDAFIGCNTNLIAPVTIKNGAYTAAGSTITDDVPANSLGIARARQTNKTNWKRKKKA